QASVNAGAVAVAANAAQPATGTNPANAAANSATRTAGTSGTAPEETLQQLDQELQRLGINPQEISLMNRMSLLLWVNDPEALRQFVQGMQPSAVSSETKPAANTQDAHTNAAQIGAGAGGNENQGAGGTAIQPAAVQNQGQNQSTTTAQDQSQTFTQQANQNSGGAPSGSVSNGESAGSTNTLQLQQLHASLAGAGQDAQGGFYGSAISQTQGQLLNISA
ncbi:MAG: hypothetical protein WB990_16915, partial [Candidatus Acidiferrales bacterium]